MKTKFILPVLLLFAFSACEDYYVPDDFPHEDFYSYTPYQKGDTVVFATSTCDTLRYVVTDYNKNYYRGEKHYGYKNSMEDVVGHVIMSGDSDSIKLLTICADRAYFEISAKIGSSGSPYHYSIDYNDEDWWKKSYDQTKIFKHFTDLISLTNEKAQTAVVKKGSGLVSFYAPSGVFYELVK